MTFFRVFTINRVIVGAFCAGAVAASGCADGPGGLTAPSASPTGIASLATSAPRSGDLHVTKECSAYTGAAGDFCTITSSNVKAIEKGSRVIYARAAGATGLDTDVVLDTPGPGNNRAFGHCAEAPGPAARERLWRRALDSATGTGLCTFHGGTGKFNQLEARAAVSYLGGFDWAWDGTFSFDPHE